MFGFFVDFSLFEFPAHLEIAYFLIPILNEANDCLSQLVENFCELTLRQVQENIFNGFME